MDEIDPVPMVRDEGEGASLAGLVSIEAEQALLGALLVENDLVEPVSAIITPAMFDEPLHGRLLEAIQALVGQGLAASPMTLAARFADDPAMGGADGAATYMVRLATARIHVVNAGTWARTLAELWARREAVAALAEAGARVRADGLTAPVEDLLLPVEAMLDRIRGTLAVIHGPGRSWRTIVEERLGSLCEDHRDPGRTRAVRTGLAGFDDLTGGMRAGDLVVVAGGPGMGETAFALWLLRHHARQDRPDRHVVLWSGEMSEAQIADRLISAETAARGRDGVPFMALRTPDRLDAVELEAVILAGQRIAALGHEIVPATVRDCQGLAAQVRAANQRLACCGPGGNDGRQRVGLVIVDYLQLLAAPGRREQNRVEEIGRVSRSLKALAQDLGVPVVALSQLSRAVEQRADRRPQLSDLRESGSIEQDADMVLFPVREDHSLALAEPPPASPEWLDWRETMAAKRGTCTLILAKHRHGPTGSVTVAVDIATNSFADIPE